MLTTTRPKSISTDAPDVRCGRGGGDLNGGRQSRLGRSFNEKEIGDGEADGTKLSYLEAGAGKTLLMVPGWSQTAEQFKHQLEGLSDKYRVIALDMRGHGDSDKPTFGYRISVWPRTSKMSWPR